MLEFASSGLGHANCDSSTNKKRNEKEDDSKEIRKERKCELAKKRNNEKKQRHRQRNSISTSAGISVIMTQRWDKRWGIRTWRHRRIRIKFLVRVGATPSIKNTRNIKCLGREMRKDKKT